VIGQSWAIGNSGKWRRKQNGATERRSTGPPSPISPTSTSARTAARSPDHLEASLAIKALDMALATRGPERLSLIRRTDRGVQYASIAYLARGKGC
jgi:hypothetical protein